MYSCCCREARGLEDLARETAAVQSIIDPCVPTWPAQEAQAFMQLALRCAPGCCSQRTQLHDSPSWEVQAFIQWAVRCASGYHLQRAAAYQLCMRSVGLHAGGSCMRSDVVHREVLDALHRSCVVRLAKAVN